ncbi:hypothetical protein HK102_011767 [Quaeritorhiza haematococci]|nr:hypothetical protein HK102_011767 [Quaeritorhiza haematococci]
MGKHKHKRKRSRSKSKSDESDHSDDDHRRKHHRKHKDKDVEKEKDTAEKEKKSKSGLSFSEISDADYYLKAAEFRLWLKEEKKKYFDELSGEDARSQFSKFVRRWNKGKLSEKYYKGEVYDTGAPAQTRTRHKWSFKNLNSEEVERAKDSVDSMTQSSRGFDGPFGHSRKMNDDVGPSLPRDRDSDRRSGPSGPSKSFRDPADEEDERMYRRKLERKERKDFIKHKELVLEELVPKETGRDAMIEKKKMRRAMVNQEKDYDVEVDESTLLGGDTYEARIAARERAQKRRVEMKERVVQEKAATMQNKVAAYRAKEQATMDMLRALAAQRQQQQ